MLIQGVFKLSLALTLALLACAPATRAQGDEAPTPTAAEAAKLLPARVGDFRAQGAPQSRQPELLKQIAPADFNVLSAARRAYAAPAGETLSVEVFKTVSDSAAYSLLTHAASSEGTAPAVRFGGGVGMASAEAPGKIYFFKGAAFVSVSAAGGGAAGSTAPAEFARQFAATLDEGAGEIPALALHLPEWEQAQGSALYAVSLPALQRAAGARPALDAVSFEGGTEAVTAPYGAARLVIVEFTTPQYAGDNDARIRARIDQLRAEGQPAPSAYRRIGNYSAFVFDAPDEAASAQLLGAVRYEKDVRWLDRNPRVLERAQQAYTNMTGNVILGALKVTGLSILLCLGVGGLFGGAFYLYRRSQAQAEEVYSDAGGMVRLNVDDVAPQPDPARLLEGKR